MVNKFASNWFCFPHLIQILPNLLYHTVDTDSWNSSVSISVQDCVFGWLLTVLNAWSSQILERFYKNLKSKIRSPSCTRWLIFHLHNWWWLWPLCNWADALKGLFTLGYITSCHTQTWLSSLSKDPNSMRSHFTWLCTCSQIYFIVFIHFWVDVLKTSALTQLRGGRLLI